MVAIYNPGMQQSSDAQFESDRWAGEMGEKWNRHLDEFEAGIREVGEAAVAAANLELGERVLDVGCGGGLTTQWLAERVGPKGTAIGIDVSARLIATARRRAEHAGVNNASFIRGDASRIALDAPVDCLFSRFGVMFFDDPYAAFRHLRRLVAPGGRVMMACWGPLEENPWVGELLAVPRRYIEMPSPDPRRPGPFAFAEKSYVTDILTRAGFTDVRFAPWRGAQLIGGEGATAESAAAFVMKALFIGELLEDQSDEIQSRAEQDVCEVLRPHESPEGVRMDAMVWLISARSS